MSLLTLGRLELAGGGFRQDKPLLLVAYLALEGPKPRKFLAELFWPGAANPMNSLAVALRRLREAKAAEADTVRAWATLECDAVRFREHLRAGRFAEADAVYGGAFAEGIATEEIGEELEDWLYSTREALAQEMRMALISLAEREAASGNFAEAGARAEAAYRLPLALPLEPEELSQVYRLLLAAEHPAREQLEREAKELGITLSQSPDAARGKLRQTLIGRSRELQTLMALEPGEWAWLQGGDGMGKTLLLRQLEAKGGWRYLPARSGLPFATLEPLLSDLEGGEEVILRRLARLGQDLLIDDWETLDPESQAVLTRLRGLRPAFRVVLAGRGEAPFRVDYPLGLQTLSPLELSPYPGAYEASDGVPALVGAWLRKEPLETALEARLSKLDPLSKKLYKTLILLETPDPNLVRQVLGVDANTIAQSYEHLLGAGLIEPSGIVRAVSSAKVYLETNSGQTQLLALGLARKLEPLKAFALYTYSKSIWDESDLPAVSKSYLAWGNELIHRGFPARAAAVLAEAPVSLEVTVLRAWALERSGQFSQALELVEDLPKTPEVLAIKGRLYYRLGRVEEGRRAVKAVPDGNTEAQAEALNVLGLISWPEGNYALAERYFRRSATLFLFLGRNKEWAEVNSNLLYVLSKQEKATEEDFRDAIASASDDLILQARISNSFGVFLERKGKFIEAESCYQKASRAAEEAGAYELAAWVWNNLGVTQHIQGRVKEAHTSYTRALSLAGPGGEQRLIGTVIANLAELNGDEASWEEAIRMLEDAGYRANAAIHRADLETFRRRKKELSLSDRAAIAI